MSGGHWDYMSQRLVDRAVESSEVWLLMAALEHELDWGLSRDTCPECAKCRAAAALIAFFDHNCSDATRAIAIARDYKQNLCAEC
mgnify:CR=1 FL=1